ncbi:MAG: hypothetical protein ACKO04_13480, partial [Actinomycetes bacterium]
AKLSKESAEVQALLQQVTHQLEAANWKGPDRERFLGEWRSHHVAALSRVVSGLSEASAKSAEYARKQEWASRS